MTAPAHPARVPWGRIFAAMSAALAEQFPDKPLPSVSEVARRRSDPFRVLVATMISLRTKDEVTGPAAERLLAAAPTPAALAALPEARIARLIYPAGFYRTKAKNLRAAAGLLVDGHHSRVPREMEELLALPGVGTKDREPRAQPRLRPGGDLRGHPRAPHLQQDGVGADRRPCQTEQALMRVLPRRYWIRVNELLVRWGQSVCTPLSPRCSSCRGRALVSQGRRGQVAVSAPAPPCG